MTTESSNEAPGAEASSTDTDLEIAENGTRPDLVWDNEMPGLCVRVYGSGKKSFIFVYRRDNRQRFVRIGTTPRWSLEGARRWAKELVRPSTGTTIQSFTITNAKRLSQWKASSN